MLFNSLDFAVFFPIVFLLYWFVFQKKLVHQNLLLLAASYYFYGCWDWRFLFLLIFSTLLDYFTGLMMNHSKVQSVRRRWFWLSVVVNLGFLGVFKYYDFFVTSFAEMFANMGIQINIRTLNIILPVGISFYTFHGLSYVIDIYNRRIEPCKSFVEYAVFVSFFPLLVAGPIERATHLLPQIQRNRHFDLQLAMLGCRQVLWGLFKKVVIADSCAVMVDSIFADYSEYSFFMLFLGVAFFYIQVYCDFSGYSDIALGTARLLGIELLRNFDYPMFSRDIAELWRRWHISLTTWFRDYIFFPLGGSRGTLLQTCRNVMIIFIVSGLWHGASWNYVVWGALNGLFLLPLIITGNNKNNTGQVAANSALPSLREFGGMVLTFSLYSLSLVFFRSLDMHNAFEYFERMTHFDFIFFPDSVNNFELIRLMVLILAFFAFEWVSRRKEFPLEKLSLPMPVRWAFYLLLCLLVFAHTDNTDSFVYFQF